MRDLLKCRRTIVLICALLLSGKLTLADPPVTLHPEIEILRAFAPILWPAADEPLVPTLPHAFAFDGRDSNGRYGVDLQDLDEISWDVGASLELVRGMQGQCGD